MAEPDPNEPYARQRMAMLEAIEWETNLSTAYTGVSAIAAAVMAALAEIPRHRFVPDYYQSVAYANGPLPIGNGQTISQPFIVALMTHLLVPKPTARVLEVGTGSGYQAAVLSRLVREVYSTEIVPELAHQARVLLRELHYDNVHIIDTDGGNGYPEQAPYDGIIVTAAAPAVPTPLIAQLKPGGHMVIPIGPAYGQQELLVGVRRADGQLDLTSKLPVAFVPLTGQHGR